MRASRWANAVSRSLSAESAAVGGGCVKLAGRLRPSLRFRLMVAARFAPWRRHGLLALDALVARPASTRRRRGTGHRAMACSTGGRDASRVLANFTQSPPFPQLQDARLPRGRSPLAPLLRFARSRHSDLLLRSCDRDSEMTKPPKATLWRLPGDHMRKHEGRRRRYNSINFIAPHEVSCLEERFALALFPSALLFTGVRGESPHLLTAE